MLCQNKNVVIVATNAELLSKHYYRRLILAARNIPIGRRCWLDEIANCLRDHAETEIVYASGDPFPIPEVDDVFNDPDCRWFSHVFRLDQTGQHPRTRSLKLDRLRLLDLYFRLNHPDIAQHFGR